MATGQVLACLPLDPHLTTYFTYLYPLHVHTCFSGGTKVGFQISPCPSWSLSAFLWHHTYSHYIINASLYIILCTHTPHAQMLSLPTSPILDIVSHPLWWVVVLKEGDTFTFLCIHFHYIITNVHNIMNNASWYHGALPPAYPVRIGWSVSPHIYVYCIGHP